LTGALNGSTPSARDLYAESFAPLVEFGWAPLRSLRTGTWKYVAAPRPELYDIEKDPREQTDISASQSAVVNTLAGRVAKYSGAALPKTFASEMSPESAGRLRALGYASGSPQPSGASRPDPKDRRALAARIAQVTSGELTGPALVSALEAIVREDPRNGQAHLRLGYVRVQSGDCARAEPEFAAALAAGLP